MIFEKAQELDIEFVLKIDNESLQTDWSKNTYFDYLTNDSALFYVIKIDGQLVGFSIIQVGEFQSDLLQIAIKKEEKSKGLGSQLLSQSLSKFNTNHEIFLEVDETNIHAINFYQKNGFIQIGIRKNYYNNGNNALVYRKVI